MVVGGGEEREIVSDGEKDSKHGRESAVIVFETTQIFCCVIVWHELMLPLPLNT